MFGADFQRERSTVDLMGVLQGFENRLEGAVEGFFSRIFRSGLQPVELARGAQRYAADNQHVTADGVVVPNVYRFVLSHKDHERLRTFGESLPREIGLVIAQTASERGWSLRGPVKVRIHSEDDVRVGRFQLAGRVEVVDREAAAKHAHDRARPPQQQPAPQGDVSDGPPAASPSAAATPSAGAPDAGPAAVAGAGGVSPPGTSPSDMSGHADAHVGDSSQDHDDRSDLNRTQVVTGPPGPRFLLRVRSGDTPGTEVPLVGSRVAVGRLNSSELSLPDSTVSREHAAVVKRGDTWWVVDLGSTNGTKVNGVLAAEQPLNVGDRIEFGDAVVELVEA